MIAYYLIVINVITFILYAIDKHNAIKGKYRIRERTLLFLVFIGGSTGALIAMYLLRHKTQKAKFKYVVPLIFIIQICLWSYFYLGGEF